MTKRYHLFEFEDQPWFPDFLRQNMMDFLRFSISKLGVYEPVVPLLAELFHKSKQPSILDLCSGGGGGIQGIQQLLANHLQQPVNITLSDKFPNIPAFELIEKESGGTINFIAQPVDATNVPEELTGCRTIFSAFHHFNPTVARSILTDAAQKRVPIGIFEGAGKSYLEIIAALLFFPVIFFFITPFMRPFRWSRLFFTYLVPLIPICTLWDGCVSILRLYTPQHLQQLTASIPANNYTWQTGKLKHKSGLKIIYLIGYPV
ncbi:class I SAM-dependent methyltransferase [Adhaeribacter rhizoryzae]|uniref:Class I SAM-dependent methyltransferase n=1 Tax=Adhaeribacter rhizoryzae TaxID=2607907 RepID=A0A5M6DQQ4_9BACT|nr:class I SAM-dependent methyltransferase [Adhaeribacter rhizoryzae]KAA5548686.1 class I SAM-dependent methyltransferase [Adhaeribacter rhizoryzae]